MAITARATPPSVEKVRRHAMPPCHRGDRFPRLADRLDDPKLLFRRPAPPPRRSGDQFNPLIVVRHRHVLEDIPKPSELCRVSGRNGGQFRTTQPSSMLMEPAVGGGERTSRRRVSVHLTGRVDDSMNSLQVFGQTLMGPT